MASRRLRLFVDAEVLVAPHFSGIGHYTLELLHAIDRQIENRDDIVVELGVFMKQAKKLRGYGFRNFKIRRSPFPLRIANALKTRNMQPPYDLFFGKRLYLFPNYTSWPTLFSKSVSIIYDLSFEYFPEYVEPRNQAFLSSQVKKSAQRAARIVTISHNSQHEISTFYKRPLDDISVIYPGIDQSKLFRWPEAQVDRVKSKYGVMGKYILFVGNIEPRKNIRNLLLAYEALDYTLRQEYSLLLIGANGWLDGEIHDLIKRLRQGGHNIQRPNSYVEDKDRAALFSGASLFVYPSLYEGFGIPPVEAMACGVPVITCNNSSLPEAVGDAAVMIDAASVEELKLAISAVLQNAQLRATLVQKGYSQADRFSWDHEANKLLKMLLAVGS